jgi:hypothetical protein
LRIGVMHIVSSDLRRRMNGFNFTERVGKGVLAPPS